MQRECRKQIYVRNSSYFIAVLITYFSNRKNKYLFFFYEWFAHSEGKQNLKFSPQNIRNGNPFRMTGGVIANFLVPNYESYECERVAMREWKY